jgi:hypothetical protein
MVPDGFPKGIPSGQMVSDGFPKGIPFQGNPTDRDRWVQEISTSTSIKWRRGEVEKWRRG